MFNIRKFNKPEPGKGGMAKDLTVQEGEDRFGDIGKAYKPLSDKEWQAQMRENAEFGAHARVLADDFPEQDETESLVE
tara:strand:+ start:4786 stop:5019 length:234 start_codon:yes stop_codon:yes gene_type:complete